MTCVSENKKVTYKVLQEECSTAPSQDERNERRQFLNEVVPRLFRTIGFIITLNRIIT